VHLIPLITFKHLSPQGDGVISNEIENKTGHVGVRGPFPFPGLTVRRNANLIPKQKGVHPGAPFFVRDGSPKLPPIATAMTLHAAVGTGGGQRNFRVSKVCTTIFGESGIHPAGKPKALMKNRASLIISDAPRFFSCFNGGI
jgi:hypothetical protein